MGIGTVGGYGSHLPDTMMHSLSAGAAVSTTLEPAWKKSVCMCSSNCEGAGMDVSGLSKRDHNRWLGHGAYHPAIHISSTLPWVCNSACVRVALERTHLSRTHRATIVYNTTFIPCCQQMHVANRKRAGLGKLTRKVRDRRPRRTLTNRQRPPEFVVNLCHYLCREAILELVIVRDERPKRHLPPPSPATAPFTRTAIIFEICYQIVAQPLPQHPKTKTLLPTNFLLPSKEEGEVRRTLEKRERFITPARSLRRRGGRLSRMACACEAGAAGRREKRDRGCKTARR
jgi:hypothetical protein